MKYGHLCPRGIGIYIWQPNKPNPKACPRCKERIDAPSIKSETHKDIIFFYSEKDTTEFKAELQKLKQVKGI